MAKKNWNNHIYRKLQNLKKIDQKELVHIIQTNTSEYGETIKGLMPVLYGGFKTSVYYDTNITATGVVGKIGIDSDKHINLNPKKKVTTDNFTNKELAGWLLNKPNKSQWKMKEITEWLDEYAEITRQNIKQYWDDKIKRR